MKFAGDLDWMAEQRTFGGTGPSVRRISKDFFADAICMILSVENFLRISTELCGSSPQDSVRNVEASKPHGTSPIGSALLSRYMCSSAIAYVASGDCAAGHALWGAYRRQAGLLSRSMRISGACAAKLDLKIRF